MFEFEPVEILGLLGGFLTAFSFVPQMLKVIKLKQAKAISTWMYTMLASSYTLWLIYGFIKGSISIVLWNLIALGLAGTILILKLVVWKEK